MSTVRQRRARAVPNVMTAARVAGCASSRRRGWPRPRREEGFQADAPRWNFRGDDLRAPCGPCRTAKPQRVAMGCLGRARVPPGHGSDEPRLAL